MAHRDESRRLVGSPVEAYDAIDVDPADGRDPAATAQPEEPGRHKRSLFFTQPGADGEPLRVDYVMVYKRDQDSRDVVTREQYQQNLLDAGLLLEESESTDSSLTVVKVHGPWDLLTTYAELLKMKMPLKLYGDLRIFPANPEFDIDPISLEGRFSQAFSKCPNPFAFEESYYKEDENYFTCPFRRDKMELFLIKDKNTFFTNAERSRIVFEVLMRTGWGEETKCVGIRRLLNNGTYEAAYPLHEGPYSVGQEIKIVGADNERQLLYELWARPKRWYKFQPLDLIRKYFGEKIGIYFTWLGLYTTMLIPVSIIGLIVFLYGVATMGSYEPSKDICDHSRAGNFTMCPLCDRVCTYYKLSQSCSYSKWSYVVDNPATMIFAIIMSVWGTLFLELWKRREAEIQYDWDVSNFEEDEAVRPEFESACRYVRLNPVTGNQEPYMPNYLQLPRIILSLLTMALMVSLVLGFLLGVIIYRVAMVAVFYALGSSVKTYAKMLTTCTAAFFNLVAILVLNRLYRVLAIILTNWERPRTETDYDNSLTFKMYCFQFVNFYASLFYIAFFKGSFVGRPGKFVYTFGFRPEECDPAGCLMELCMQMLIIFVGKQIFNNFMELGMPIILNLFRRRQLRRAEASGEANCDKDGKGLLEHDHSRPQWERDYPLEAMTHLSMFDEYLEMVIQYGFVTLFVAAMPLAPLFALINNVIEIRIDAFKMVTQWRRPFAARAQDIGIWYNILKCVAVISILTNAFIIGYTSDTIPRLVYRYYYNAPNGTLEGYVNFSLSVFNTHNFENRSIPAEIPTKFGPTVNFCRYRGFREPPSAPQPYEYTRAFWHIFTARFVFILVFEHLVLFLTTVIAWIVPDMPEKLKVQQQRERYLAQEVMFKADEEVLREKLRQRRPKGGGEAAGDEAMSAL